MLFTLDQRQSLEGHVMGAIISAKHMLDAVFFSQPIQKMKKDQRE